MTKREIAMVVIGVLLLSSLSLYGAIYTIDHYVLSDESSGTVSHGR